jgi:hypothetical protein
MTYALAAPAPSRCSISRIEGKRPTPGEASPFLVSAIVSAYRAERFMRALLEDLEAQTIADRLEIIICDSDSPENEGAIVREFQRRYDNIVYFRTPVREPSQVSFNRCIQVARGRYLTIANADDRHRPDALEVLARALDARPGVGLVYADSLITRRENETFARNTAERVLRYPPYSVRQSLMFCHFGPQAMWRANLGDEVDWFDEDYSFANDMHRYIDLAWRHGALHVDEVLGLYLEGGFEEQHREKVSVESCAIAAVHRSRIPLEDIYPGLKGRFAGDPVARAAALVDFGVALLGPPWPDPAMARSRFLAARALVDAPGILCNVAVLDCLTGAVDLGRPLLETLARQGVELAAQNLRALDGGGSMQLFLPSHPVVSELPPLWRPADCVRRWP